MTIRIMIPESKKKGRNTEHHCQNTASQVFNVPSLYWVVEHSKFPFVFLLFFCLNYAFHPFPVVVRLQLE